uniref:Uncharacterized protein n=1 Tax=uncultured marine group II/III euryarchaeote KM3_37_D11 TaxID=1456443 RepID=A0A075H2V5_9EURY|nr:hypothetical protein [uncultured marine group II/III euryarchaeote KM3_37_D11]
MWKNGVRYSIKLSQGKHFQTSDTTEYHILIHGFFLTKSKLTYNTPSIRLSGFLRFTTVHNIQLLV